MLEIANDIKKFDYYRYLCCLLAPAEVKEHLIAIYAFNNEIAKIKYVITEPMAGHVRLQWWRDAIEEIYNSSNVKHNHQVVNALLKVVDETKIERKLFDNLIDAREKEIDFSGPNNMEQVNTYLNQTCSNLFKILLSVCGYKSPEICRATNMAGIAYGLVHIMCFMRYNCHHRRVMLPRDLMDLNGISEEEIIEGKNLENTYDIVKQLCDDAIDKLKKVRLLQKDLPKNCITALMPLCLVEPTVKKIRSNNYNLFDLNLEASRFYFQLKILSSRVLNKF